jgi:hypothetical protein
MTSSTRRTVAWIVAGTAVVAAVVTGLHHGFPVEAPRMLFGAAWLPSPAAQQLTLLDGSTVQAAAQVRVPVTNVFQQGQNAYAVDTTTGTVRRVDGATMTAGPGVTPIPGATTGLRVFATADVLHAVDTVTHRVAEADASNLAPRGRPRPLPEATDPEAIHLDDDGRLWVFDTGTGTVSVLTPTGATERRRVAAPGRGKLVMADGRPVVVDLAANTAARLDPDNGRPRASVRLGMPPMAGDPSFGGSPDTARIYPAVDGQVSVCDLTGPGCGPPIVLGGITLRLGTPVEEAGRLFVPDYTTGGVFIVDVASRKIIAARPRILERPGRFELIAQGGLVFFDDPAGARAGLIRPGGEVVTEEKYDSARAAGRSTTTPRPGPAVTSPPTTPSPPTSAGPPSIRTPAVRPPSGQPPSALGPSAVPASVRPSSVRPASVRPASVPPTSAVPPSVRPSAHPRPPVSGPVPSTSPPTFPGTSPSGRPVHPHHHPPGLEVNLSSPVVAAGDSLTLTAEGAVSQPDPLKATWSFGDGETAAGLSVRHEWHTTGEFTVRVTATFPGGDETVRTVQVTVAPAGNRVLTVTPTVKGRIVGGGIDCGPKCVLAYSNGDTVTLTAIPRDGYVLSHWKGASCHGHAPTCTVKMDCARTVAVSFQPPKEPVSAPEPDGPQQKSAVTVARSN